MRHKGTFRKLGSHRVGIFHRMLEPKLDSSVVDESRAPTIVPSAASVSDFEKDPDARRSERGATSDGEELAPEVAPIVEDVEVENENEKPVALARSPTATSHAGASMRQTQTREDGTEYPTGVKLGLITLALCLSVFLMALDNSIIATAIPKITDQFHSLPDVGWYGSGTFSWSFRYLSHL